MHPTFVAALGVSPHPVWLTLTRTVRAANEDAPEVFYRVMDNMPWYKILGLWLGELGERVRYLLGMNASGAFSASRWCVEGETSDVEMEPYSKLTFNATRTSLGRN